MNSLHLPRSRVGMEESKPWYVRVPVHPRKQSWIKEVEMVASVDDLKSSRSLQGFHVPDFEMLDAKIASGNLKIIQNFYF